MSALIPYRYGGEGEFRALPRFVRECDKRYVIGELYPMEEVEERSMLSHRHFFAAVRDAWMNLPEEYGDRFSTPDHLRRWCLIKAGFRDERSIVAKSKAQALEVAAFVRPLDQYAVVVIHEATVTSYTAKSQSLKAMGKKDFQASKDAVLGILDEMLGVERGEVQRHAGVAA